ncbi:MAG: hypothetical protein ABIS92_16510 [Polyangia bacterium]
MMVAIVGSMEGLPNDGLFFGRFGVGAGTEWPCRDPHDGGALMSAGRVALVLGCERMRLGDR